MSLFRKILLSLLLAEAWFLSAVSAYNYGRERAAQEPAEQARLLEACVEQYNDLATTCDYRQERKGYSSNPPRDL